MYVCMTICIVCMSGLTINTYIDINALAQGIKSFLALQVWFQAVAGARTYDTDSPAITSQYVCMYVCLFSTVHNRKKFILILNIIPTSP